ncbi:uncharacterized protein PgNI_11824 [Pyricularia grisea]|uniref:Uncharacterized protein n=1 Tax=Pyricularia grisea TaxID=148305 RepID=A0A6P8AN99_PYRGI|nr:uncharacterized protein PgNI_11824 [Pyricularia grisea]TLD03517.1 hypothetical protein PgNI_11824 [Pyricularia grisea]
MNLKDVALLRIVRLWQGISRFYRDVQFDSGRATTKKTAEDAKKRSAEPPASTTPAPAAAPVKPKPKARPKTTQAVNEKPTTEKPGVAKKPAQSKNSRGKRGSDKTEQEGKESSVSTQNASQKRVRRDATTTEAQAEPRWAEKSKNDDKGNDCKEERDDKVHKGVQGKPNATGGAMAGFPHTKDGLPKAVVFKLSEVFGKDNERDIAENKVADVKKVNPAAPIAESLQKPITKTLASKKPNEEIGNPG